MNHAFKITNSCSSELRVTDMRQPFYSQRLDALSDVGEIESDYCAAMSDDMERWRCKDEGWMQESLRL